MIGWMPKTHCKKCGKRLKKYADWCDDCEKMKDNSKVSITKDKDKSYVYIKDGNKDIGVLMWDYKKKKWLFENNW